MSQVVGLPNNSYKPIANTAWVRARLCKLQKGCTRLAAASNKVYQLLAHGRWFSPGTPASSYTKTGRHDIAEILLKVALNTRNQIKSISIQQSIDGQNRILISLQSNNCVMFLHTFCFTCIANFHSKQKIYYSSILLSPPKPAIQSVSLF